MIRMRRCRNRDFRLLLTGRFITSFGNEMLSFAIGWELWLRTHQAFVLGMVGLVQVIPVILLSLPAGSCGRPVQPQTHRVDRRTFSGAVCAGPGMALLYPGTLVSGSMLLLLGIGIARAFNDPASSTLLPQTVPPELFSNAATWSTSTWQFASITGPALAGLLIGFFNSVTFIYVLRCACRYCLLHSVIAMIKGRQLALAQKSATWKSVVEGFNFMRDTKVILAAITLDMFAVLFGGAVALLPIYATDILTSAHRDWASCAPRHPSAR